MSVSHIREIHSKSRAMISDFEKYLHDRLSELQDTKAEEMATTIPNWVTKQELFDAIEKDKKAILNKWFKEGKIKVHKTIHAPIHDFVELVKEE